jgi:hypothetical protein
MSRTLVIGIVMVVLISEAPLALAQMHEQRPAPDRHYQAPPERSGPGPNVHQEQRQHQGYQGRWDGPAPQGWDQQRWRDRQSYLRRYPDHRDDHSDAIITGLLGFALGAAIAGSEQDQRWAHSNLHNRRWLDRCARHHRSFDPRSGTYLGRDGLRYYCRRR